MPHVNEFHRARMRAATALLAVALVAGCTDTQRRTPVMAEPTGQNLAGVPVYRLPAVEVVGRRSSDVAASPDAPPPATTSVSIGAARRAG